MTNAAISDAALRSFPSPERGQKIYWDASFRGFGVRVSQGGAKTFVVKRNNSLLKIGRYIPGVFGLSQARTEAKKLLAELTLGRVVQPTIAVDDAIDLFLDDKRQACRPRTIDSYTRLLHRFKFTGPVSHITNDHAAQKLAKVTAPSERAHMLVAGKVFFNWCRKRRYFHGENPLYGLTKPKGKRRTRTLNDNEIRLLWLATDEPTNFNRVIRTALLTGQRARELSKLAPSSLTTFEELPILVVPEDIAKNRTELQYPLCPFTAELLKGRHNYSLLFSDSELPINDWSQEKQTLDERIAELNGGPIPHWTIHDLRRTYRTLHAKLGTPPHIAERLVHHISARTEVERIYDQYAFLPEMRLHQEKYECHLAAIVDVRQIQNSKQLAA